MALHRLPASVAIALILSAAGTVPLSAAQPAAAQPAGAPPEAPTEQSVIAARETLWNYQSCGTRAQLATYHALAAELRSIEDLAQSKGLGPVLERVRAQHERILAVTIRVPRPCAGGPAEALGRARQAIAAFRAWVEAAPVHVLTQAERDAAATRAIFALEDVYAAAILDRDEAALRRILDNGFAFDRSDGTATNADGLIATMGRLDLIHHRMTARTAAIRGDVGIVTGTIDLASASATQPVMLHIPYSATYRMRDGAWRMVALHMAH